MVVSRSMLRFFQATITLTFLVLSPLGSFSAVSEQTAPARLGASDPQMDSTEDQVENSGLSANLQSLLSLQPDLSLLDSPEWQELLLPLESIDEINAGGFRPVGDVETESGYSPSSSAGLPSSL